MAKRKQAKKQSEEIVEQETQEQPEEKVRTTRVADNGSSVKLEPAHIQQTETSETGGLELLRGKGVARRVRLTRR